MVLDCVHGLRTLIGKKRDVTTCYIVIARDCGVQTVYELLDYTTHS